MRLFQSNLYKPRENCTLLQTFSFSYIATQHLNFAALTSARLLATQKHNLTTPSYLKSPVPNHRRR